MRFLINATHDIRSPLTLIMGPLNKLKERITDKENLDDIQIIDRNAQRLLLLVNQILDERKIDKNQMKLHCRETDIVPFVRGIFKLYDYNAQQRGIHYTFSVGEQPAETGILPRIPLWIDRVNFDKVISNLLSNAFKYTFDGGEINVEITEEEKNVIIKVRDNGIGLNEDKPERLFDRFYQGSNSRDLHLDGTGIGLNLSKAIVNMHGGEITAQNREDGMRGTVLTIVMKKGNSHLKAEEIETEEEKVPFSQGTKKQPSKNFKILIVDDDAEIGSYITQELGGYYHISSVTSAREALRLLLDTTDEQHYDLVVSDVMMPEMDGFTFLRMVKTNMNISHIPVVMLTSKADVANRLEGLEKGADAYLAKPFDMDELHMVISNLINKNLRLRGKFSGAQQQKEKVVEKKVKGNDEQLMERIMKVVNDHLSDSDLNVEMLTSEVGISRAQLHRKMKEMTGLPISEFIRNIRLEQAVRLLKEQKINVTQVAYSVGFSNLAHFSTVFRKQFGVSPSEYIERNQKGDTKQQVNET
jgi:DNA-binding response OmpR family regulator/anti-sigma regulatory factor (Ser/Thr protein kinase)